MATTVTSAISSALASATATSTASCVTAVPGKYGHVPPGSCNSKWNYDPSFAAAVLFLVLFLLTMGAHIVQAVMHRKSFCWVLTMGAAWEAIAFILRALGAHDQQNTIYAMWTVVFALLAPLWINAFLYMLLARMIWYWLPERKIGILRAERFSVWFIVFDIVTFLVQATGAVIASNTGASNSTMLMGIHIYMGGIGMQEAGIIAFSALAIIFFMRMNRGQGHMRAGWKTLSYVLFFDLGLITIRIIFRLVEYGKGFGTDNPIPGKEWYYYVFDALTMLIACVALNAIHPGAYLKGKESEFPTRKEKKEMKKRAKANARGLENMELV